MLKKRNNKHWFKDTLIFGKVLLNNTQLKTQAKIQKLNLLVKKGFKERKLGLFVYLFTSKKKNKRNKI